MLDEDYKLVKLAAGVCSVRSLVYGETFHPVIGPEAEARALYLDQLRLAERMRAEGAQEFVIWDVGLGAAANSVTVLRATRENPVTVRLVSFDRTLDPLRFALEHTEYLPFLSGYEGWLKELIQEGKVCFQQGSQSVLWDCHVGDFSEWIATPAAEALPKPHAILFDAHSPARNPEMWTLSLFERLCDLLDPDRPCALATFSRSTMLRVTLLAAGYFVGRGHATGEKEETTIAANRMELIREPLDAIWLQRARRSTSAEPLVEPKYRQAPLSAETSRKLDQHPQFALLQSEGNRVPGL